MKRPIIAWSMNQRDQSGPFGGRNRSLPKQTVRVWFLFSCLWSYSVSTTCARLSAYMHLYVRSHRLLACLSDASFSVSYRCATPPLALAPVYHTWLQAIQRDNDNKRIDFFDYILYHKCMYCTCIAANPLCSPPLLVIMQSYHAVSCSDTKAANFHQEPKL